MTIQEDYKEALRTFIERAATPVVIDTKYSTSIWESYSVYDWRDSIAMQHIKECGGIVVPTGVTIREVSFSQFEDSVVDDSEAVGLNAWGGEIHEPTTIHCVCGEYSGMMVRWEGSFYDAMQGVLGFDEQGSITI